MRSIQRPESEATWSFVSCIRTRKALVWPFEGILFRKGTEHMISVASGVTFEGILFCKGTERKNDHSMPSFGGILFRKGTEPIELQ